MKKLLRVFAALSIAALSITSCAEKEEENAYDIEQRSFDAWMQENVIAEHANPENVVRYSNGVYIEWLTKNPEGAQPAYGNWLKLDYTGRTLSGNVYKTRNKSIAEQEREATPKTNYVPAYINYYELNGLTPGENFAIGKMRKGEKVIAYLPSRMAYKGSVKKFSNGYGGHFLLSAAMIPVQIELELADVITDASAREKDLVAKCLAANGMNDTQYEAGNGGDKIKDGIYAKVLTKHDQNDPEVSQEDKTKYNGWGAYTKVDKDDELYIYRDVYVIQEEPGNADGGNNPEEPTQNAGEFGLFLVSTDRMKLAEQKWSDFAPYTPVFVKPSLKSDNVIYAIREAFVKKDINYMSSFVVVTTSEFAYGKNGFYQSTEPYGEIPPYTPLLIRVYVERKTYAEGTQLLANEDGVFGKAI